MKTNPEEFLSKDGVAYDGEVFGGKWSDLLDYAWRIATDEEQEMIKKARNEFYRDDFNERVFKRLAGEEKQGEKEETRKIRLGERYGIGQSDPRVMQLQEQAMREEIAKRQYDAIRQSKTPFGGAGKGGLLGWW
jgi:ClpP class serine protease